MSTIVDSMRDLRAAQKPSRGVGAYSRYINRPFGRLLAAVAHTMGLSPNTVTLVSGTVTMSGIAVLATVKPAWWSALLVAGLLVLGYALDSADGQVARLSGRSSPEGEWLDHVIDAVKLATLHLAVAISWYRWFDLSDRWLLVPLLFQAVTSAFFFTEIVTDLLRRHARLRFPDRAAAPDPNATSSPLYALAVVPADYGLWCLAFLTWWVEDLFVTLYTGLAVVNALLLPAACVRWFRSVRALPS